MKTDRFFQSVPRPVADQTDLQPCRTASPKVIAQCEKLRVAYTDYMASVENGVDRIDHPEFPMRESASQLRRAWQEVISALNATSACKAQTIEDLALKQCAFANCLSLYDDHPQVFRIVLESMFIDTAYVARQVPAATPTWKFPAITFPASWSLRTKQRRINGSQS